MGEILEAFNRSRSSDVSPKPEIKRLSDLGLDPIELYELIINGKNSEKPRRTKASQVALAPNVSSLPRMQTANSRSRTSDTFQIMLNSACLMGVIPIYWNRVTGTAEVITNKWMIARWVTTLTTMSILLTYLLAVLVHQTMVAGFQISNPFYMIAALTMTTGYYALFFHFHVAYRRHELAAFINGIVQFWTHVKSHLRFKPTKSEQLFWYVNRFMHAGLFFASVSGVFSYFMECKQHILYNGLPVCWGHDSNPYAWFYRDPILFMLGAWSQFTWIAWQATDIMTLVVTISATIIFSHAVLDQLEEHSREDKEATAAATLTERINIYRGLQILGQQLHVCFSQDVWPAVLSSVSLISILMFTISVRTTDHISKAGTGVLFAFFMAMLWGFLDYGCKLSSAGIEYARKEYSKAKAQAYGRGTAGKYRKKMWYSCMKCASFRVYVGGFGYLKKSTVAIVIYVVTQNICAVLISTSE